MKNKVHANSSAQPDISSDALHADAANLNDDVAETTTMTTLRCWSNATHQIHTVVRLFC